MRRTAPLLLAFGLLCVLGRTGWAADDEVAKIIDKAIKAHFPKGLDTKNPGIRSKSKGTLHIMGLDLEFNQEVAAVPPSKFKETMELTVMDKKVTVVTAY